MRMHTALLLLMSLVLHVASAQDAIAITAVASASSNGVSNYDVAMNVQINNAAELNAPLTIMVQVEDGNNNNAVIAQGQQTFQFAQTSNDVDVKFTSNNPLGTGTVTYVATLMDANNAILASANLAVQPFVFSNPFGNAADQIDAVATQQAQGSAIQIVSSAASSSSSNGVTQSQYSVAVQFMNAANTAVTVVVELVDADTNQVVGSASASQGNVAQGSATLQINTLVPTPANALYIALLVSTTSFAANAQDAIANPLAMTSQSANGGLIFPAAVSGTNMMAANTLQIVSESVSANSNNVNGVETQSTQFVVGVSYTAVNGVANTVVVDIDDANTGALLGQGSQNVDVAATGTVSITVTINSANANAVPRAFLVPTADFQAGVQVTNAVAMSTASAVVPTTSASTSSSSASTLSVPQTTGIALGVGAVFAIVAAGVIVRNKKAASQLITPLRASNYELHATA